MLNQVHLDAPSIAPSTTSTNIYHWENVL